MMIEQMEHMSLRFHKIVEQIDHVIPRFRAREKLMVTCITLHPEHMEEFRIHMNMVEHPEPLMYKGIPVYEAARKDPNHPNPLLDMGYSIVGHYDSELDCYVKEQQIPLT